MAYHAHLGRVMPLRSDALREGTGGVGFTDGFGTRRRRTGPAGVDEVLTFRDSLTAVGSFEFAVRERVARVATLRDAAFAEVRRAERAAERRQSLTVVSAAVDGTRLSDLLVESGRGNAPLDPIWALAVVHQVLEAVDRFHRIDADLAHSALGAEHIIITPDSRAVVVDYAFGPAIEQLAFSPQQYWDELGVATDAIQPSFDQRMDVMQVGVMAFSLLLGRPFRCDELSVWQRGSRSAADTLFANEILAPLARRAHPWVLRALQLDAPFMSAAEACEGLEELIAQLPEPCLRPKVVGDLRLSDPVTTEIDAEVRTAPLLAIESGVAGVIEPHAVVGAATDHVSREVDVDARPTVAARTRWPRATNGDADRLDPVAAAAPAGAPLPVVILAPPVAASVERATSTKAGSCFPDEARRTGARQSLRWLRYLPIAGAIVLVGAVAGARGASLLRVRAPSHPAMGMLTVTTPQSGATLLIDGVAKGTTPMTLNVATGRHILELREGSQVRTVPVTIIAGAIVSEFLELPPPPPETGTVHVRTQPIGAWVAVDGIARGRSPVKVGALKSGDHIVTAAGDFGVQRQTVTVEGGASIFLSMSLPTAGAPAAAGWLVPLSAIPFQIFEQDQMIGSNETPRVMLSVGTHHLDLVNTALGFHASRTVQIAPDKSTQLPINLPSGVLAINAVPWAEVWLDGERLGDTPIGNATATIGVHRVMFRHPTLGEQTRTMTVLATGIARVSVDLRTR